MVWRRVKGRASCVLRQALYQLSCSQSTGGSPESILPPLPHGKRKREQWPYIYHGTPVGPLVMSAFLLKKEREGGRGRGRANTRPPQPPAQGKPYLKVDFSKSLKRKEDLGFWLHYPWTSPSCWLTTHISVPSFYVFFYVSVWMHHGFWVLFVPLEDRTVYGAVYRTLQPQGLTCAENPTLNTSHYQ